MLELALKAKIPIIAVRTRDVLNLPEIIEYFTGKDPEQKMPKIWDETKKKSVYIFHPNPQSTLPWKAAYEAMVPAESAIVVVNPNTIDPCMFDAGEVPVPKDLLLGMLMNVVSSQNKAEALLKALGGCTIKEAVEYARLTMARDKSLTAHGITLTRTQYFPGQRGLTHVLTEQKFYVPDAQVVKWVKTNGKFFVDSPDPRLTPRGLLFTGPPGTGKTSAAKYIASALGVPLYRLDIAGTKNKWVGSSEQALTDNLMRIDREEPCVVLIDEVEKVLSVNHGNDSGTTESMMSQLLWWLAEHQSRVLTLMTSNNEKKLPPELHREGRIDATLHFAGLEEDEAVEFMIPLLETYSKIVDFKSQSIKDHAAGIVKELFKSTESSKVPHALLTSRANRWVTDVLLQAS